MKTLFGDFSVTVGREDIFKLMGTKVYTKLI